MQSDGGVDQEQLLEALHHRGEQLSNILASLNAGVVVVDNSGQIVLLNDVSRNRLGLTYSPELTLGAFASQFGWQDRDGQRFTAIDFPVTKVLSSGLGIDEVAVSREFEGSVQHFRLSATPLSGRDGSQVGAVAIFHDVTELVTLQEELEEGEAQRLGFYTGMSHELRTPLQGIMGYTDLMIEEAEDGSFEMECLKAIRSSCDHLLSLVTELLDLSKIVAGRMELNTSPTDISVIVSEAISMVASRASEKGVSLEQDLGEVSIHELDQRALRQVILNLISNAIKYTDSGGVVTVGCHESGGSISLEVNDTGVGISEDDQGIIFREFVQVAGADGRQRAGTGLGLALSKRFVELHGGTLEVFSEVGVGSTFRVEIPI